MIIKRLDILSKQTNLFSPALPHTDQQKRIEAAANKKASMFLQKERTIENILKDFHTGVQSSTELALLFNLLNETSEAQDINNFIVGAIINSNELFNKFFIVPGFLEDDLKLQNFIAILNFKKKKHKLSREEIISKIVARFYAITNQQLTEQKTMAKFLLNLDEKHFIEEITHLHVALAHDELKNNSIFRNASIYQITQDSHEYAGFHFLARFVIQLGAQNHIESKKLQRSA
jgi:hypothetical protein